MESVFDRIFFLLILYEYLKFTGEYLKFSGELISVENNFVIFQYKKLNSSIHEVSFI